MSQRPDRINTILASALNWQESTALAQSDLLMEAANATTAKEVAGDALEKITFLQDALIFALREHRVSQESATDFDFWTEINGLVEQLHDVPPGTANDPHDNYFYAIATAKLFRALMSTRSGHPDGLPWGRRFSYPRTREILPGLLRFAPFLARSMNTARLNTFINPVDTDAAVLAGRLLRYASTFFDFYDTALTADQKNALRAAIQDFAFDPQQLAPVWKASRVHQYNCLPLDKLWTRDTNCVYLRHCIGFGEFAALKTYRDGADARLAQDKWRYLQEAEAGLDRDRLIARNWWCCGFMYGMYRWRNNTRINKDIVRDLESVLQAIETDNTYRRLSTSHATLDRTTHIDMVRAACEGASPDDIWGRFRSSLPLSEIYSFLFTVATTPKSPKLQDCWRRPILGTDEEETS